MLILSAAILFFSACRENVNIQERNKSEVIKGNDELFNKGNLSWADANFSDDYAGRGPEYIKEYTNSLRAAFPDLQVKIDPIIAEGNMTAWRRTHTGTHKGEYMGFQPTGRKITWHDIIISRYDENGKILEEWGVGDLYEILHKESLKGN